VRALTVLLFSVMLANGAAAQSSSLINGGVVTGAISSPGEQDSYTFTASVGESIRIRVADIDLDTLSPYLLVYDPSGALVNSDSDSVVAEVSACPSCSTTLPMSGLYTVVIKSYLSSGTGRYNIYFVRAPGANEGGVLSSGEVLSDSMDLGDINSYTFTASVGESIRIRVADIDYDTLSPYLIVYDPSGALVNSDSDSVVAEVSACPSCSTTLPMSGVYTVVIHSYVRSGTGRYNLYFVRAPGANEGGLLTPSGEVRTDSIDLGDIDSYTFVASVGETIQLVATDTTAGTLVPYLLLYSPSGALVASHSSATAASVHACPTCSTRLPMDGTYTVVVTSGTNLLTGTGPYSLDFTLTGDLLSFAALGDSYSSGEGVFPYFDTTNILSGCHRSTRAYSTNIRTPGTAIPISARSDAKFDFFACSGAVTENLRSSGQGQNDEPPQLASVNGVNASRDLVTLTIGGNDAQFLMIFAYCMAHDHCNDLRPFSPHSEIELGDLFPLWVEVVRTRVIDLLSELKAATPNAATLVLGYPVLLSGVECDAVQAPFFESAGLSKAEQVFLRDANQRVNTAISEAAALVGMHWVDVEEWFVGHEICGASDDWINGLVLYNPKASFHPTSRGQLEYAGAANDYLNSTNTAWPFGYHGSGLPRNPDPVTPRTAQGVLRSGPANPMPELGELVVTVSNAPTSCSETNNLIVPGQFASLVGRGFAANESVAISMVVAGSTAYDLGVTSASSSGEINTSVQIPSSLPLGSMCTIEALAAGRNGIGRLLLSSARTTDSLEVDADLDGIPDGCDNCPVDSNSMQADLDGDGRGDACDPCPQNFPDDGDGDGICGITPVFGNGFEPD
jgi:GDSL-like Lipase/Acylhydrolase family